jgi:HK97 family phage major capsid protein
MAVIDKTKQDYIDLLGEIKKDALSDLDAKSQDILLPKVEKMVQELTKKRDFSMYAGLDGGNTGLSEVMKTYGDFGNPAKSLKTRNGSLKEERLFSPELVEFYAEKAGMKGWKAAKIEAFAGFLKGVWMDGNRMQGSIPDSIAKAMGETTGSAGGFMVPIEFRPELLRLIIEDQVVRPNAFVVPMTSDTLWWPKIVDTSHVSVIHGGFKGTVNAESADLSSGETDPTFGLIQLIAKKYSDFKTVPNEMIMDSPISVMPLIGVLARQGLGFYEDRDAIWGTGSNTSMKGFMKSGSLISVTRSVPGHINWEDILGMQSHLFPSSYKRAVWVCAPSAIVDLGQMGVTVGMGGSGVWIANIPGQNAANAIPLPLLGRPLIISEKMQTLGTAGDIALCDFGYYIIGDRMDMTLAVSTERYFEKDQTGFRIVERVDGQPWIDSALTAYNGTDTLSAFIALT